jgi:DivIVA domain-containing protein
MIWISALTGRDSGEHGPTTRLRPGYSEQEVDDFLDEVTAQAAGFLAAGTARPRDAWRRGLAVVRPPTPRGRHAGVDVNQIVDPDKAEYAAH